MAETSRGSVDVVVSYDKGDGSFARELREKLRLAGFTVADSRAATFSRFDVLVTLNGASGPGPTFAEDMDAARAAEARVRETEHALRPFAALLGGNPRALKRLVNAYGVARDIEILNRRNLDGTQEDQHRTALWTLLNLRWPRLGDYLAEHPDAVSHVGSSKTPPDGADGLETLFADDRVVAVVEARAEGVHAKLDPSAIRRCTGRG